MKIRIKFSKQGPVKFVGHLDTMRYFQKAIRRAGLPVAFSGGYSPHMLMSFAAPLGVGITSKGEYFDLELKEAVPSEKPVSRLNDVMAEGWEVLEAVQVEEGKAGKAMSLVAAADYRIRFRPGKEPACRWTEQVEDFLSQKEILVVKQTKKGEKQVDIRPYLYEVRAEQDTLFLKLASASANYTQPGLVMDTFFAWMGVELPDYSYMIERLEIYADKGTQETHLFVPLGALGDKIE